MKNIITLGDSSAVPARFVGLLSLVKEQHTGGYSLTALLTEGLPATCVFFEKEEDAVAAYNKAVEALEAYYDE